jgi:lysophospholipase L1-like esterase
VIHVSLGTNDDPRHVSRFRAAVREVLDIAGRDRCVVWTNIARRPVAGVSYAGYNRSTARESRPEERLRVVNWARLVRENPDWLAKDGVHASADGYRERARAVARSVRRCD